MLMNVKFGHERVENWCLNVIGESENHIILLGINFQFSGGLCKQLGDVDLPAADTYEKCRRLEI